MVPSACIVYFSPCWWSVTMTFGAVTSYTWVVWGRWRVMEALAVSAFRVVVCRTMQWTAHSSCRDSPSASSLTGAFSMGGSSGGRVRVV